jgi:mRNA-degrading endonuclease RelE of RelBE toxin-antitoxin system
MGKITTNNGAGDRYHVPLFPEFRLRVGDYRLRFHDYGHTLYITAVKHRREAYR